MRLAPLANGARGRDSVPPRRGGKLYQFAGVGDGRLRRLQTSHHPGKLHCAVLISDQNNSAGRDLTVVRFHHHIVSIREGGDLCEMGDHNHLGVQGQPGEAATHLHRDLAANTCVDLVEDQVTASRSAARTTSKASRTRDSSPPGRARPRLRSSLPGLAANTDPPDRRPMGRNQRWLPRS